MKRYNDDLNASSLVLYGKKRFNKPPIKLNFNNSTFNRSSFNFNFLHDLRKPLLVVLIVKWQNIIFKIVKKIVGEHKNRHTNSSISHEPKLFVTSLAIEISDNSWYIFWCFRTHNVKPKMF